MRIQVQKASMSNKKKKKKQIANEKADVTLENIIK